MFVRIWLMWPDNHEAGYMAKRALVDLRFRSISLQVDNSMEKPNVAFNLLCEGFLLVLL